MASDSRRQSQPASSTSKNSSNIPTSSGFNLNGRAFLLEIDNHHNRNLVTAAIQKLEGEILVSFHEDKLPLVVVSDHALALKIEQKKIDVMNPSEKMLRALPSLLREAVQRKIKIRTVDTFMKQLSVMANKHRKTASATNSTGTIKNAARVSLNVTKPGTSEATAAMDMRRRSSNISATHNRCFVRIDALRKKPDMRVIEKGLFGAWFCGTDAGFSVFRKADINLKDKRTTDFDKFLRGDYRPQQKATYKIENEETYCQFCRITVQRMFDHEKTDGHKARVKFQGTDLHRVVMATRMAQQRQKRRASLMSNETENTDPNPPSKMARIEKYEYGENECRLKWNDFISREPDENEETKSKPPPIATFCDQTNEAAFLSFIGR